MEVTFDIPPRKGAMTCNEAYEAHFKSIMEELPEDVLTMHLKPAHIPAKNFCGKMGIWVDQGGNRPMPRKELLVARIAFLDMLDAYERMSERDAKFPHNIFTKAQINRARDVATTVDDLGPGERAKKVRDLLYELKFRKGVEVTPIGHYMDGKIAGEPSAQAARALLYWIMVIDPPYLSALQLQR